MHRYPGFVHITLTQTVSAVLLALGVGFAPMACALLAPPEGDTYVNSTGPNKDKNFGTANTMQVGAGASALIQFNLDALPPGIVASEIDHANVILFVNKINTVGAMSVSPVTSAWNELTVKYTSIPSIGSPISSTPVPIPASVLNGFVVFDVTDLVRAWVANPALNNGLLLAAAPTATATHVVFDTKENGGESPLLDISLAIQGPKGDKGEPGATGATGATGPKGNSVTIVSEGNGANCANGGLKQQVVDANNNPVGSPLYVCNGAPGAAGAAGAAGTAGAAATVTIGTVTTGAAGSAAQVSNSGTSSAAVLSFTIPQGAKGDKGDTGATGTTGATGAQGVAGNLALAGLQCPPAQAVVGFDAAGGLVCRYVAACRVTTRTLTATNHVSVDYGTPGGNWNDNLFRAYNTPLSDYYLDITTWGRFDLAGGGIPAHAQVLAMALNLQNFAIFGGPKVGLQYTTAKDFVRSSARAADVPRTQVISSGAVAPVSGANTFQVAVASRDWSDDMQSGVLVIGIYNATAGYSYAYFDGSDSGVKPTLSITTCD